MNKITTKKILTALSIIIILSTTALGISEWRSHMAFAIDSSTSYIFNEIDLTDPINYQIITNTYLLGLVFTLLGTISGCFISASLWVLYFIISTIIYVIKEIKNRKPKEKTKFSKKELIEIADNYVEKIEELEKENEKLKSSKKLD